MDSLPCSRRMRASRSAISSSASSQVTRSNCAEPRGPTRRMGHIRRSGLFAHARMDSPRWQAGATLFADTRASSPSRRCSSSGQRPGQSMAQNAGVRVSAGKAARVCGLVCAPICDRVCPDAFPEAASSAAPAASLPKAESTGSTLRNSRSAMFVIVFMLPLSPAPFACLCMRLLLRRYHIAAIPAPSHAAPVKAPHRPRRTRVRCAILGNCSTTTDS